MFRVIIAGTRTFDDYDLLCRSMDYYLQNIKEPIQILCGLAKGADQLGLKYACEHGYEVRFFPADWKKYGRAAGPIRNLQMVQNADALVAFWDGKSFGTKNIIRLAKERNLNIRVKQYISSNQQKSWI